MKRKLSEIIIEIAMQGLADKKYANSEVMHPLMFLASVAWNREIGSSDYSANHYLKHLKQFTISAEKLQKELISNNWEEILTQMANYKRKHFPKDKRVITSCGYTPRNTFRVEWE